MYVWKQHVCAAAHQCCDGVWDREGDRRGGWTWISLCVFNCCHFNVSQASIKKNKSFFLITEIYSINWMQLNARLFLFQSTYIPPKKDGFRKSVSGYTVNTVSICHVSLLSHPSGYLPSWILSDALCSSRYTSKNLIMSILPPTHVKFILFSELLVKSSWHSPDVWSLCFYGFFTTTPPQCPELLCIAVAIMVGAYWSLLCDWRGLAPVYIAETLIGNEPQCSLVFLDCDVAWLGSRPQLKHQGPLSFVKVWSRR